MQSHEETLTEISPPSPRGSARLCCRRTKAAEDQAVKCPRSTYPLRLPRSAKAEVERRVRAGGISINQVVTAVAEKVAATGPRNFSLNGASGPISRRLTGGCAGRVGEPPGEGG